MTKQRTSRRANGHAGPNGRPNGHGPASLEGSGAPEPACPGRLPDHAASVDASGLPVARAAAFVAAANLPEQARTDREAYAEVAPPPPNGAAQQMSAKNNSSAGKNEPQREVPRGEYPLPDNPAEFVEEIHRKIDIAEVWHGLLRSKDEKVRQRAVERLTAMRYDDDAISADETQPIVWDVESAVAHRPAEAARTEGARK